MNRRGAGVERRALRRQLVDAIEAVDLERVRETAAHDPTIVRAPTSHGNVPLSDAIATGSLELVKLMVELGADPHHANHGGHSVMDGAAYSGRAEIVRYFASLGVPMSVHHAAAIGEVDTLRGMLAADPSLMGLTPAGGRWTMTPLHAAVLGGSLTAMDHLLSVDAPVDSENHNAHTSLALTPECGSPEARLAMAERLLSHGAEASTPAGHHGGTILHRAIMQGEAELAKLLLEHGADPNRQDWSGKTPLHYAAARNRKLVALLLAHAPDLSVRSRRGETALAQAMRLRKSAIVRLLESAGADA